MEIWSAAKGAMSSVRAIATALSGCFGRAPAWAIDVKRTQDTWRSKAIWEITLTIENQNQDRSIEIVEAIAEGGAIVELPQIWVIGDDIRFHDARQPRMTPLLVRPRDRKEDFMHIAQDKQPTVRLVRYAGLERMRRYRMIIG